MKKIVVIGAVAAGSKAAAKSKRLDPEAQVDIYTDDTHVSYSACGLPYYVAGNFDDYKKLIVRTPEKFEESGIQVHLSHRVLKILPETKQILVRHAHKEFLVDYDKLVVATGAVPIIAPIKNVNLENVFTLRTLENGIAIKQHAHKSKHATIVGGGYIGIELLEAFVKQGLKVTMVEFAPHILSMFDEDISKLVKEHILSQDGNRVEIINSDAVVELVGDCCANKVVTRNGNMFETDMVVLSTGVKPNVELAKNAGIELGQTGAIKVDKHMKTSIDDIYACGDCCEKIQIVTGAPTWVPLGSTANKEGRCAALNLNGHVDEFQGVLGSAVTKYFGLTMSMTGLSTQQALESGLEPVSVVVTKLDKAGYMPEVKNITIKLIADKKSRKLIGAQAIGCGDADKRVNVITTALLGKMTADEFFNNDMTYAPPFSPSIDPLLNAAQMLVSKLNK